MVAAVLFAILLLSDRVRLLLSRFVSRHFQRPLYDYRTVWRHFTEATASCVNQHDLCQVAVKTVTDVFQALSVTIWLVDEQQAQLVFIASTFLTEAKAGRRISRKSCGPCARSTSRWTLTPRRPAGRRFCGAASRMNSAKAATGCACR
jgi:hypothetical protein